MLIVPTTHTKKYISLDGEVNNNIEEKEKKGFAVKQVSLRSTLKFHLFSLFFAGVLYDFNFQL